MRWLRGVLVCGFLLITSLSPEQPSTFAADRSQAIIRVVCTDSTWALKGPGHRISSVRTFVASSGRLFPQAVRQARQLHHARYWVSKTMHVQNTCIGWSSTTIELGVNARNHTYLMAIAARPLSLLQRTQPLPTPPPPGKAWSTWWPEGGVRAPDRRPVAYLARLPLALAQSMHAVLPSRVGANQVLSRLEYRGSGYRVVVTTMRCAGRVRCHRIMQRGRPVTLEHGIRARLSVSASGTTRNRLMWIRQGILIRVASNLPVWWVERLAEQVIIAR